MDRSSTPARLFRQVLDSGLRPESAMHINLREDMVPLLEPAPAHVSMLQLKPAIPVAEQQSNLIQKNQMSNVLESFLWLAFDQVDCLFAGLLHREQYWAQT
jgi:hypothetical protein